MTIKVLKKIDDDTILIWIKDLIITKSFKGLKLQKTILECIAKKFKKEYRLANTTEESQGIDGFIGEIAVSIKPKSYKSKKSLKEKIDMPIIYYYEKKNKYYLKFDESDFE